MFKNLKRLTGSSFLLRKWVRANERQAAALEDIARTLRITCNVSVPTSAEPSEDDDFTVSYSNDRETWERIERDRRKSYKIPDE